VSQCVAVCCSVVAVFCSVLQDSNWALQSLVRCHRRCLRVAVCCSVLQCVAVCCSALQFVAVCCSLLQCVAVFQNWARQTSAHSDPYVLADKKKYFGRHLLYSNLIRVARGCCGVLRLTAASSSFDRRIDVDTYIDIDINIDIDIHVDIIYT